MATIAGEAGAGKTRLISAFAGRSPRKRRRRPRRALLRGERHALRAVHRSAAPARRLLEPTSDWVAAELGRLLPELPSDARAEVIRATRHRLFEAVASR